MKVGKLILPNADYHLGKRAKLKVDQGAQPEDTTPLSPFLIYEVPIRTPYFAGFIFTPELFGEGRFDSTLVDSTKFLDQTKLGTPDAILEGSVVLDPAPVELQKLIENAAKDWKPFLEKGALSPSLVNIWIDEPEIFDRHIDRRKDPSSITRQNSFILLAWGTWEERGLSTKERIADMKAQGYGELGSKAFEKRTKRLNLPSKRVTK